MDDTAAGIISPAATYPSVPALGFFIDATNCVESAQKHACRPCDNRPRNPRRHKGGDPVQPLAFSRFMVLQPLAKRLHTVENNPADGESWDLSGTGQSIES